MRFKKSDVVHLSTPHKKVGVSCATDLKIYETIKRYSLPLAHAHRLFMMSESKSKGLDDSFFEFMGRFKDRVTFLFSERIDLKYINLLLSFPNGAFEQAETLSEINPVVQLTHAHVSNLNDVEIYQVRDYLWANNSLHPSIGHYKIGDDPLVVPYAIVNANEFLYYGDKREALTIYFQ